MSPPAPLACLLLPRTVRGLRARGVAERVALRGGLRVLAGLIALIGLIGLPAGGPPF